MISIESVRDRFDYLPEGQLIWKKARSLFLGRVAGSPFVRDYRRIAIDGKAYLSHRIIWLWHGNELPDGYEIDHIDGNRENNRIENLRISTHVQNTQNAARRKDNSSGVKGVSWHKDHRKWQAYISINRKREYLGLYDDLSLAAKVVTEARNKLHGSFAKHA